MNARQRRLRRRYTAPAVLALIGACEAAAQSMRETGQAMTPEECAALADGLREMLRCNPEWARVVARRASEPQHGT